MIAAFIQRAVVQGIPLLFGSTGEIITEKSGNLNLGIPGIMIKHDSRSSTTDGFLATSINIGTSVNDIVEIIEAKSKNIENESKKLNEHKKETMSKYLEILKERLHD